MKKIVYLFAITFFLFSCSDTENKENDTEGTSENTEITENTKVSIDVSEITEKVKNWRGGAFLKEVSCTNGNIKLVYVKDFNDLKATYPVISSTEEDYKKQMGKEFHIDKMLAELPLKLFMKFTDANSISMNLPFEATEYKINITKKDIEDFTGKAFSEILEDYNANYADKYVFDEAGRAEFVTKFVKK